jgi:cobalt-zinc-cadmium efflux system protein
MNQHNRVDFISIGNKLKYGTLLSLIILIAEVIGGLISHSLALLSDAGHVFADIVALGLSWYGVRQAARPSNSRMTFGYHRIGVVVAIVNALQMECRLCDSEGTFCNLKEGPSEDIKPPGQDTH